MTNRPIYNGWDEVRQAPSSRFFASGTMDAARDRKRYPTPNISAEANFTQSNGRVLIGQSPNGALRFAALPTRVYPAPTDVPGFRFGPGMYYHTDNVMYVGDLTYRIVPDGRHAAIDLGAPNRSNATSYRDHYLPVTTASEDGLECTLVSLAPVAADANEAPLSPAPLPGPAGALYALHLRNTTSSELRGKIMLDAGDALIRGYDDLDPEWKEWKKPQVDIRQHTLCLIRPDGAVGIRLAGGKWVRVGQDFTAELEFRLPADGEFVAECHIALGAAASDLMPTIYELSLRSSLDWINLTGSFWASRLGRLTVGSAHAEEEAALSLDVHIRNQIDSFNCLQTDERGRLIALRQGAPSHGYGTIWGIDVEPTAAGALQVCPELAKETLLFFLDRSRVPVGDRDPSHSMPIFVAPVIVARLWLQATGDAAFFEREPDVLRRLTALMEEVLTYRAAGEMLFPTRYSSDGEVGRKYDYGTNVKIWYAFDSLAYLYRALGEPSTASRYDAVAAALRASVERTMTADGPFGRQVTGGTNLGEEPGGIYLPEDVPYYDGEDTASMLAPVCGFTTFDDETWRNYHRFARSLYCPTYDPEYDTLLWAPREPMAVDGTALVSRIGGSVTPGEMADAFRILRDVGLDDAHGSLHWWPFGRESKRGPTRCSQGQGAWAWLYMRQWLGIEVDAVARELTVAPRGLPTRFEWLGFAGPSYRFDLRWEEMPGGAELRVRNDGSAHWTVRFGVRPYGRGAQEALAWQRRTVRPGEEAAFRGEVSPNAGRDGLRLRDIVEAEAPRFADEEGVIFFRYGPAFFYDTRTWDTASSPLQLRFVVGNATGADWRDAKVTLSLPDGWTAASRRAGDANAFEEPAYAAGVVGWEADAVPAASRIAAPFAAIRPNRYRFADARERGEPFHLPSQPGNDMLLATEDIEREESHAATATLTATAADGRVIERRIDFTIRFVPLRAGDAGEPAPKAREHLSSGSPASPGRPTPAAKTNAAGRAGPSRPSLRRSLAPSAERRTNRTER